MVAAAGCGIALVVVLLAAYFGGPIARADATALQGMRSLSEGHQSVATLTNGLAHSVDLPYTVALLGLICGVGVAIGRRRQAVAALAFVALANVMTQVLKISAAHPRYQSVLAPHQLGTEAFPSGHATAVASLVLAAVLVAPASRRLLVAIAGAGYALAVSIALVIAGWHFPSDVVGAFLVVGGSSMLVLAALRSAGQGTEMRDRRTISALRVVGALVLPTLAGAVAVVAVLLLATHPGALFSYVASHTTAVVATIGIAAASLGLVSGVTAELGASG